MLGQAKAEEVLREHLAKYGCYVERSTELRTFEQHTDRVVAHLVKQLGDEETTEIVVCHWLAGTDGAKSIVHPSSGSLDAFHSVVLTALNCLRRRAKAAGSVLPG